MDIKINKDIATQYPDDAFKGFSVRQLLCIGTAAVLGIGIILFLYYGADVNIHAAVYVALPVPAVIVLAGFMKYKGMPLITAIKEWIRLADQPVMVYQAEENHYDRYQGAVEGKKNRKKYQEMKKARKKRSVMKGAGNHVR